MRQGPPAVFPLLRSELQARVLARTLLGGGEESVAELAAAIEADPGIRRARSRGWRRPASW